MISTMLRKEGEEKKKEEEEEYDDKGEPYCAAPASFINPCDTRIRKTFISKLMLSSYTIRKSVAEQMRGHVENQTALEGSLCDQSSGTHFLIPNVFCKYNKGIHIKIWSMTSHLTEIKVFSTETPMTFMLDGHDIQSFTLPCREYSLDENLTSGYKLSSSQVISVYVEYLHDVYLVYSLSSLGYIYVIPILPNSQQPGTNYFNFTVIMSYNNNTTLTLTTPPSHDSSKSILKPFVKTSPSSHVLVLNDSETVTISCQCSLSGFRLVANQPVFVIFGQYSKQQNNEYVLMIESLQPVSTLTGQYFVYVPNWIQINSVLYILALQNDTKITWRTKNGEQSKTLAASQQQLSLSLSAGDFAFIHSEKGVLLLTHIHHTMNQPNAMALHCIPPTLQYLNLKLNLGNGIDDDCDSRTDEELNNQKDDDGDGLFDEDLTFVKGCKLLGLSSNEGETDADKSFIFWRQENKENNPWTSPSPRHSQNSRMRIPRNIIPGLLSLRNECSYKAMPQRWCGSQEEMT
ncbi:Hypothetical predicted protein [Octopus vulgaris]|uniref:IgGFc-binding protein N-terminal domain-containing protein n=1 Tax=Octopus vulgaris TaxID=6645 RepID=A0AA36F7Q6_OCTVU|nr:Hypothetical predicted protein [Octopus vulgaris]